LIEGELKVFNVGAEWFYEEMNKQNLNLKKIDWAPPIDVPDDISNILNLLKGKKTEVS
jgi:hypothetical protein